MGAAGVHLDFAHAPSRLQSHHGRSETGRIYEDRAAVARGKTFSRRITRSSIIADICPHECGESGQAQTYFNRASLLIHSTKDKATRLAFKLCQVRSLTIRLAETLKLHVKARLADFSRRFNEAAVKYHDLSFEQDIVEEERIFML
jgi:hypothetical protein